MAFVTIQDEVYQTWFKTLVDIGVVPPETCRIIIDAPLDGVVRVYYQCNADKRMFNVDFVEMVKGAEPVSVEGKEAV